MNSQSSNSMAFMFPLWARVFGVGSVAFGAFFIYYGVHTVPNSGERIFEFILYWVVGVFFVLFGAYTFQTTDVLIDRSVGRVIIRKGWEGHWHSTWTIQAAEISHVKAGLSGGKYQQWGISITLRNNKHRWIETMDQRTTDELALRLTSLTAESQEDLATT